MTDEEIIALAEKTKKEKYCKKYLRDSTEKPYKCDLDCPFNYDGMNCEDEYETAFLDGFKAAYNILKIDVNKLTIGDVRCAIKQSPQYAELLLRSIGEEFRDIMIRNHKKHNDNN